MAVIDEPLVDGPIDVIRAKIASVLLDELQNQATVSNKPFLNIDRIWKERETPFNLSEVNPIAINLQVGTVDYGDKYQRLRVQEIGYFIDIYTVQKHTETDYADQLAVEQGFQVVNAVQYILDHPEYRALKLEPNIRNVKVNRIDRGEATLGDGAKGSVIRVEYSVQAHTRDSATDPGTLEGADTEVTVGNTENGFFYQINF